MSEDATSSQAAVTCSRIVSAQATIAVPPTITFVAKIELFRLLVPTR
jgi:hypothetical protein